MTNLNNQYEATSDPKSNNLPTNWQLIDAKTMQQAHDLIIDVFAHTYHHKFSEQYMGVNHALQVELRGVKFVEGWVTGFLLTPWMLCQLYVPTHRPTCITIEADWQAKNRQTQNYQVIGPMKTFQIGEEALKGFLNYDKRLGHYLLQPLVQAMQAYPNNAAAFAAWSQVIATRKAHYEKLAQAKKTQQATATDHESHSAHHTKSRRDLLLKWQ